MQHAVLVTAQLGEFLHGPAFDAQALARACGVPLHCVHERVAAGVLQADASSGELRFDSVTLVRARRVWQLESAFEADPQLAALTADLIEEVTRLRRQVHALAAAKAPPLSHDDEEHPP